MHIQDLSNVITNIPFMLYSAYCSFLLFRKYHFNSLIINLFAMNLLCFAILSFCGIMFHINNDHFFLFQKYGSMIAAGLASFFVTLASFYDNYRPVAAKRLVVLLSLIYLGYLVLIVLNYRFLYFIVLSLIYAVLLVAAYLRQFPSRRSILVFSAVVSFLFAGGAQASNIKFYWLDHNDIFHLISLLTIFCFYRAADSGNASELSAK